MRYFVALALAVCSLQWRTTWGRPVEGKCTPISYDCQQFDFCAGTMTDAAIFGAVTRMTNETRTPPAVVTITRLGAPSRCRCARFVRVSIKVPVYDEKKCATRYAASKQYAVVDLWLESFFLPGKDLSSSVSCFSETTTLLESVARATCTPPPTILSGVCMQSVVCTNFPTFVEAADAVFSAIEGRLLRRGLPLLSVDIQLGKECTRFRPCCAGQPVNDDGSSEKPASCRTLLLLNTVAPVTQGEAWQNVQIDYKQQLRLVWSQPPIAARVTCLPFDATAELATGNSWCKNQPIIPPAPDSVCMRLLLCGAFPPDVYHWPVKSALRFYATDVSSWFTTNSPRCLSPQCCRKACNAPVEVLLTKGVGNKASLPTEYCKMNDTMSLVVASAESSVAGFQSICDISAGTLSPRCYTPDKSLVCPKLSEE